MIARGRGVPEPKTRKELAYWMIGEIRRLKRRIEPMSLSSNASRLARAAAWMHGMREITTEAVRLSKKIPRGADNDRA